MSQSASLSTQYLTNQSSSTLARVARGVLATSASGSAPLARLALAVVMFPHGAQKALGWWGGYGLSGTLKAFTEGGMPWLLAASVIAIELVAPLLLVLGLGTRLAALGIGAVMVGAIATVHAPFGFFMNWFGNQAGEGFEFHLLALGLVAVLLVAGGGSLSLDRRLAPSPQTRARKAPRLIPKLETETAVKSRTSTLSLTRPPNSDTDSSARIHYQPTGGNK